MGRKQLHHVQYKRNIDPVLVEKMDRMLIYFKKKLASEFRLKKIHYKPVINNQKTK